MSVRVYVPSSLPALHELLVAGGLGPAPLPAHAVTEALRAAYPDGGEEEWEYAAMAAAAQDSLALLGEDGPHRRVVVVADVDLALPVAGEEPTLVEVGSVVPLRALAAVHVDAPEAEPDVAAAVAAWSRAVAGDEDAARRVERCLDHDLGWYATQEIGDLVGPDLGRTPPV